MNIPLRAPSRGGAGHPARAASALPADAAAEWRVYRTPGTVLEWSTLEEWYAAALALDARRSSSANNRRKELHVAALPVALIGRCACRSTLTACLDLLRHGPSHFRQPPRGERADAPHTALIVAVNNRLSQLGPD